MAPVRRSGRQTKGSQKALTPEDRPAATTPKVIVKKPKASRQKKWTPEKLLTDPKSPLVDGDIRAMLSAPEAWDILTEAERTEIIALLPAGTPIINAGAPDARPDMMTLASDDTFRHDCAMYAENLGDGKHDPEWLEEAWTAHDERAAGEFEEYIEHHFEEEWGVKLPDDMKKSLGVVRNDSSTSREVSIAANGTGEVNGKDKEADSPSKEEDEKITKEEA
ncbi:hypothetical protein ACHAQA_008317 [Verticillium albo-atrum]